MNIQKNVNTPMRFETHESRLVYCTGVALVALNRYSQGDDNAYLEWYTFFLCMQATGAAFN